MIVAAENDQAAFSLVDIELEKFFLKPPEVDEVTLYERSRSLGRRICFDSGGDGMTVRFFRADEGRIDFG